jgi:hypothetical protein
MPDQERKSLTAEETAQIAKAIKQLGDDKSRIIVEFNKARALLLIGGLQLLLRHPRLPAATRGTVEIFIEGLSKQLEANPAMKRLIEAGVDPAHDVPADQPMTAAAADGYKISDHDAANIGEIVAGDANWFGARLIRLIKAADEVHRRRLAWIYPTHVAAVERWERTAR